MVCQKSDYLIVVMKCVKAHGAKGITNQRFLKGNTWDTGGSLKTVEHELKDIRYQSAKYERLETLMNRVNEKSLKEEHRKQARNKATGVDGVTKDEYGEKLDENVANLIERMKKFSYKPLPVRRVFIPKANGKVRPLGTHRMRTSWFRA